MLSTPGQSLTLRCPRFAAELFSQQAAAPAPVYLIVIGVAAVLAAVACAGLLLWGVRRHWSRRVPEDKTAAAAVEELPPLAKAEAAAGGAVPIAVEAVVLTTPAPPEATQ